MSQPPAAPFGFAYLFEKFPSFSQTFCCREVCGLRQLGWEFPVFSIRRPSNEPDQDCFGSSGEVSYLPEKYDEIIAAHSDFRRAARTAQEDLRKLWGGETEKRRVYEALWLLPRLQRLGVRHVHVHFAGIASRTAFWLHRLGGISYSITAHANDIFRDEPPERLAQIFASAKVVVTVSDFSVRFLQEQYPASSGKFCRVYNGIETERFRVTPSPVTPPRIVAVGRYIEKKGFSHLVEACALLRDRDFTCQIVGHGPLEEPLQAQIAALGLEGKVILTGPKTEGEIKDLLAGASLMALPCVTAADGSMDNLPTVIMEGMAAELPVVSTAVAGVPEMVIDGETGYVIPEQDVPALAGAILRLLDHPEQARIFGRNGLARCQELFDLRQTTSALAEVLTSRGAVTRP